MRITMLIGLLAVTFLCGCRAATLVLHNGSIVTVDKRLGTVEALAIRGDRIVAVGSNEDIEGYIDDHTEVIDLQGRLAIPGFIEGHGHFTGIGESKMNLDLMRVENWDQVIEKVREAVGIARPGEWILGRGWHQEKWNRLPPGAVRGFPTHHALSAISPDNPVCLTHASGHACFFNAKAMEMAGVNAETPDPPGGEILRDATGAPIGVFSETASSLVSRVHAQQMDKSPEAVQHRLRQAIRLADRECYQKGITSFQDAGSSFATIETLRDMVANGEVKTRMWVMVRDSNERLRERLGRLDIHRKYSNQLTVRAIKRTIDGALGSRGAWLLEPYTDEPDSTGLNTATVDSVTETACLARQHGLQFCVHAIGDRANREVLDIFEQVFSEEPPCDRIPWHAHANLQDARWRVEHAQHLHPDDIPRFARMGVIASMQGVHCTSDGPWVIDRLGHRRAEQGAYVWQKLWRSGAMVTNGTDAPVEDVSPIAGFYATVSRRLADGTRFFPDQAMSRTEALKSYTINCAYAAFEEDLKGSLTPGKLADVVVLSNNIIACREEEIPDTKVLYTIIGGEIVYAAKP